MKFERTPSLITSLSMILAMYTTPPMDDVNIDTVCTIVSLAMQYVAMEPCSGYSNL